MNDDGPATVAEYVGNDLMVSYGYVSGDTYPSQETFTYLMDDDQGNVAIVTDASGNVTTWCGSDTCGANPSDTSEFHWEGGFGYSYRPSASVYQVGVRVYDANQGRFLQQDPLSFGSGDWTYAGNSPANAVDPTGLAFRRDCVGLAYKITGHIKSMTKDTINGQNMGLNAGHAKELADRLAGLRSLVNSFRGQGCRLSDLRSALRNENIDPQVANDAAGLLGQEPVFSDDEIDQLMHIDQSSLFDQLFTGRNLFIAGGVLAAGAAVFFFPPAGALALGF